MAMCSNNSQNLGTCNPNGNIIDLRIPNVLKDPYDFIAPVQEGKKNDNGKLRYDLLDPLFVKGVVEVLTVGAKKYADNNWKFVDNAKNRYKAALLRHLFAYLAGEEKDPEDQLDHLDHASCNIMFLKHFDRLDK